MYKHHGICTAPKRTHIPSAPFFSSQGPETEVVIVPLSMYTPEK